MSDTYFVKIDGVEVDTRDPCALWQALYAFKLKVLSGGKVDEFEIRSSVTTRRTKFGPANMAGLEEEMSRLHTACSALTSTPRRTRYAIRGTFRPH